LKLCQSEQVIVFNKQVRDHAPKNNEESSEPVANSGHTTADTLAQIYLMDPMNLI